MPFEIFDLEKYQSLYEYTVQINLADSSAKCINIADWLNEDEKQLLLTTDLFYPQVNGTQLLRERIAAYYPGSTPEQVLVTVGASEANSILCETLLEPGDEVIVTAPGYRQIYGLAKNRGCVVKELMLDANNYWQLNLDNLAALITPKTKLMSIVNPNNPTGTILTQEERNAIINICAQAGIWLHADEVYQGTEISRIETPSFWGQYDKLIVTNSLSKAYRLAGLRIGWMLAAPELIQACWRRHEYAVIAASAPSMKLAEIAMLPERRQHLFETQHQLSVAGRKIIADWLQEQNGLFSMQPSAATAICFVRYHFNLPSVDFAEQIRKQASVLVAPGSQLGAEYHLRLAVGYEPGKVKDALERISKVVAMQQQPIMS